MKRKWASFFLCVLGILILICICFFKISQQRMPLEKTQHVKCEHGPYFFLIDITKFTLAKQPCLFLQINNIEVSAMLDLGFRGQFGFSLGFLESIKDKEYFRSKIMYGICGNAYEERLYRVPKISIGPISFSNPIVHECSDQSHLDSIVLKVGDEISISEPCKIGWELFGNTNLFLDLGNSKIAFCDGLTTLKEQGYEVERFIRVPLLLERGLLEFEVQTSKGLLRCMLDTGSTWNVLNIKTEKMESANQIENKINDIIIMDSFQVNNYDFGAMNFHCIPIKLPIQVEAILGMEFFERYTVFLDFSENYAYLAEK